MCHFVWRIRSTVYITGGYMSGTVRSHTERTKSRLRTLKYSHGFQRATIMRTNAQHTLKQQLLTGTANTVSQNFSPLHRTVKLARQEGVWRHDGRYQHIQISAQSKSDVGEAAPIVRQMVAGG